MSIYPVRVKKFLNKGVDPHDALILPEIRENLTFIGGGKVRLTSFNHEVKRLKS
jgi:hypothetical protein